MPGHMAGLLHSPAGVILHGSRSGAAGNSIHQEFEGTASWAVNNPDGLCWNATIGEDEIALHLPAAQWGHNARAASDNYLAVEFAQAVVGWDITDAQVDTFCWWVLEHVDPVWGPIRHFPTHAEVEDAGLTGQQDGKSDVYATGDIRADELRAKILARLG